MARTGNYPMATNRSLATTMLNKSNILTPSRYSQSGFVAPIVLYAAAGAAVLILSLGVALKVQSSRLTECKASYAAFKTDVERLGKEAKQKAEKQVKKQKGVTNEVRNSLDSALKRMRVEHANSGNLPAPALDPAVVPDSPAKLRLSCALREQYATEDAIRLHEIQRWLIQQGFPVE